MGLGPRKSGGVPPQLVGPHGEIILDLVSTPPRLTNTQLTDAAGNVILDLSQSPPPFALGIEATVFLLIAEPGTGVTTTSTTPQEVVNTCRLDHVVPSGTYFFEVNMGNQTAGDTTYCQLYDVTAGAAVPNSTLSTTLSPNQTIRSTALALTAGHTYTALAWVSAGTAQINIVRVVGVF